LEASAAMPRESTDPVSAAFSGWRSRRRWTRSCWAPDLLIIKNRLPKAMFICFLTGGPG
jgi:hypothetical protein